MDTNEQHGLLRPDDDEKKSIGMSAPQARKDITHIFALYVIICLLVIALATLSSTIPRLEICKDPSLRTYCKISPEVQLLLKY